jgi:5-oxopent-3-ene-1,2,5-tricarboxylate decarboxylase/2-hydroxyhepta-2,4-diene-1,7-dioate isomerase
MNDALANLPHVTHLPEVPFAPWRLSGTVVGALLNHKAEWEAIGAAAEAPPHKGRAQAPVLQVKPRNTLVGPGAVIEVPAGAAALEVGATLGAVISRTACRVRAVAAAHHIGGYVLAADLRVPHESHYRPSVRHRARDGFCPLLAAPGASMWLVPAEVELQVLIDGRLAHRARCDGRVRGFAELLADVSAFMTLQPGDVLLLGTAPGAPLAAAGQRVQIIATRPAVGPPDAMLPFSLVAEGGAAA